MTVTAALSWNSCSVVKGDGEPCCGCDEHPKNLKMTVAQAANARLCVLSLDTHSRLLDTGLFAFDHNNCPLIDAAWFCDL